MYISLIQNAALLVALSTLYGLLARFRRENRWIQLLSGLLFGAAAVVGMLLSYQYEPGVIYDGRSIILAAGGLFSGGIGTIVSIAVAGTYRALLGGAGVWAGLATIVLASFVGHGFRVFCRRPPEQKSVVSLYLLGIAAHVVMLACQLLLPWSQSTTVISRIWLPVMLIFPAATVMVGFLLRTEERRVQTASQLEQANERFSQLVNELSAAVWTASVDGRQVQEINDAIETISGLSRETIKSDLSAWWRLVHPEDHDRAAAIHDELIRNGRASAEYRIVRPDGEVRWIRDNRSMIYDSRGVATAMGGLATDVTEARNMALERETLRVQVLQSQKMEAVGRLAGGIAHDFNNLLTVINNYAEIAMSDPSLDEALREDLSQISVAGQRAAQLTRQLLAFSRQQPMAPRTIDLNDLVKEVDTMLSRLLGANITVQTHLAEDLWMIQADPGQIHQVLMNLVVNARDAMPEGGTLTITTANGPIEPDGCSGPPAPLPEEWVSLTVSDTGHGMNEEIQERIFEPFFTTKESGVGTGLGLSTAYGIVAQSGGHIHVRSEPGKATTFAVVFPRAHATVDGSDEGGHESLPGPQETILVAEDEPAVRELTVRILKGAGYTVLTAESGAQAVDLVEANPGEIHLLLTDVVMPGLNGRELAASLRVKCPELKVVFMSGYSEDALSSYEKLTEGIDFVSKPFDRAQLLATIRRALETSD